MEINPLSKELGVELGKQLGISDPAILAFIVKSPFKKRNHKAYKGYSSHSYRELDIVFGRSQFENINKILGLYHVLSYSKAEGLTRGLKPTSKLIQAFNNAIDETFSSTDDTIEIDNTQHKIGAVYSRKKDGNNCNFKSKILQAVKVNNNALRVLAKSKPITEKEQRIKFQAAVLLDLSLNTSQSIPKGYVVQRYVQQKTGRIYGINITLQNVCREVRHAALNKLFSYDINNCHYSILSQLTTNKTPTIEHYLKNKSQVRNRLSTDLSMNIDDVKTILISIIYGARLGKYKPRKVLANGEIIKGKAISNLCKSEEVYNRAIKNKLIENLYLEVKEAGHKIIEESRAKCGKYAGKVVNAMGLVSLSVEKSKLLSHILQGYEVKALEAMISVTKTDTALLLHDGIVTYGRHNISTLEAAIKREAGLVLSIDCQPIECKNNDVDKSPTAHESKEVVRRIHPLPCKLIERELVPSSYFLFPIPPSLSNLPKCGVYPALYPNFLIPYNSRTNADVNLGFY